MSQLNNEDDLVVPKNEVDELIVETHDENVADGNIEMESNLKDKTVEDKIDEKHDTQKKEVVYEVQNEVKEEVKIDTEKEVKEEVKEDFIDRFKVKKTIIILALLLLVSSVLAGFLIYNKYYMKKEVVAIYTETKENSIVDGESKYLVKDLTERYKKNSLDYKLYDRDNKETTRPLNFEGRVEFYYIQISGLKNKDIESKINSILKERSFNLLKQEDIDNPEIKSIYIIPSVAASFSNVLSISISIGKSYKDSNKEKVQEDDNINIRLDTGEELRLRDIFLESADIKTIILNALYNSIAIEYGFKNRDEDSGLIDYSKINYPEIEDKVFLFKTNYDENQDLKFHINYNQLYVEVKDLDKYVETASTMKNILKIDLLKNIDTLTLYKKFLTDESLFVDDYYANNKAFVFTMMVDTNYTFFDKVGKNLFLDTIAVANLSDNVAYYLYNNPNIETSHPKLFKVLKDRMDVVKSEASKNNTKGYLYKLVSFFNKDGGKNTYSIDIHILKYEMPLDYFEKNALSLLAMDCRFPKTYLGAPYSQIEKLKDPNIKITGTNESYKFGSEFNLLEKKITDLDDNVLEHYIKDQVSIY